MTGKRWSSRLGGLAIGLTAACLAWLAAGTDARDADVPADIAVIPADATSVVSVRLADLWTGDFGRALRAQKNKILADVGTFLEKDLGVSPEEIARISRVQMSFESPREFALFSSKCLFGKISGSGTLVFKLMILFRWL
jgi:hypothetical protein